MKNSKEEIKELSLEAFPVNIMYGGGQPQWDDNKKERTAFIKGFEFRQFLEDATMINSNIPLHIKYRMYKNQQTSFIENNPEEQDENWEEAAGYLSTMRASLFNPMGIVRELEKYFIIRRK